MFGWQTDARADAPWAPMPIAQAVPFCAGGPVGDRQPGGLPDAASWPARGRGRGGAEDPLGAPTGGATGAFCFANTAYPCLAGGSYASPFPAAATASHLYSQQQMPVQMGGLGATARHAPSMLTGSAPAPAVLSRAPGQLCGAASLAVPGPLLQQQSMQQQNLQQQQLGALEQQPCALRQQGAFDALPLCCAPVVHLPEVSIRNAAPLAAPQATPLLAATPHLAATPRKLAATPHLAATPVGAHVPIGAPLAAATGSLPPGELTPRIEADDGQALHHKISLDTFNRYGSSFRKYFPMWLAQHPEIIVPKDVARVDVENPQEVEYYDLLDEKGELRVTDVVLPFLDYLSKQPSTQRDNLKITKNYITAVANIARGKKTLPNIPKGLVGSYMQAQVLRKQELDAQGKESITTCQDQRKRVDKSLLTFDEMMSMADACLSVRGHVSPSVLISIQTMAEFRLAVATGVRGEKLRTATFDHLWRRHHPDIQIPCYTFFNTRKGKTNVAGEAVHAGWIVASNPIFSPSALSGLCCLQRFNFMREKFPSVTATIGEQHPGYQYKWLPLFVSEVTKELDTDKALLPLRGVTAQTQNDCWTRMFAATKRVLCKGDAVTHTGRYEAQQRYIDSLGDTGVIEKVMGYAHSVSADCYQPNVGPTFLLQRAGYGIPDSAKELALIDAPHVRVLRECTSDVDFLVDAAVPGLKREEAIVSGMNTKAPMYASAKEVRKQKERNRDSHAREAEEFLLTMRSMLEEAIVLAACRTRKADNTIDIEGKTVLERYGPCFKNITVVPGVDDEWTGKCIFDHPAFKRVQTRVRELEDMECAQTITSPTMRILAHSIGNHVFERINPTLDVIVSVVKALQDNLDKTSEVRDTMEKLLEYTVSLKRRGEEEDEVRVEACKRHRIDVEDLRPELRERVKEDMAKGQVKFEVKRAEPAKEKPKRNMDTSELTHATLKDLRDIHGLWREYAGKLREMERSMGCKWRHNEKSMALWQQKAHYYREVARVAYEVNSIEEAVERTNQRLVGSKNGTSGGWKNLKICLIAEHKGSTKMLNKLLDSLHIKFPGYDWAQGH